MSDGNSRIEEIEGMLQEEDGQLKKGAERHDEATVRNAEEKLNRIIKLDTRYINGLESEIEEVNRNLRQEANEIESFIGGDVAFDKPLDRLENVEAFMDNLEQEIEENGVPNPNTLINGGGGALVVDARPYGIKQANKDITHAIEVDLNPLSEKISPENEAVELENLKQYIKETVEVHQRLNEFKRLLELALEDEELLEKYAENDHLSELENSGEELEERTNKLIERVQELEDKEKDTINLLKRAHKIISNRIEFDQSVLENFQDKVGSEGGRLISNPEGFRRIIAEIREAYDESSRVPGRGGQSLEEKYPDLYEQLNILESNLENFETASRVLNEYRKEEQEIYNINQAIEGYIDAHQDLFSESRDMDEHTTLDVQRFDTQGYDPNNDSVPDEALRAPDEDGFDKSFYEIAEELRSHSPPSELIEELNRTQERFEEIHRLDEEDEEGIREFEEHLSSAKADLEELKGQAERFVNEDSISTEGSTNLSSGHLKNLVEGGRDEPGLEDVHEEVEALQRNLGFLYTHEDNERATFHSIKSDLQGELKRVKDYMELFDSYKNMKNRLVRKKWSDGSAWESAVKYVSYQLFMSDSDISDLEEAMDEFKLMVKNHKRAYNELESRVEDIENLLSQEIKIREDELDEMQDSLEDLDSFRSEFIDTIEDVDNVTDDIPDGLNKVLDDVDTKLGKIEKKLGKIEQAKERDDIEMEHIIEGVDAADETSDTKEDEGSGFGLS